MASSALRPDDDEEDPEMKLSVLHAVLVSCALASCGPHVAAPSPAASPPPASAPAAGADVLLTAARGFAAAEIEWQSAIAVGRALTARGVIRGSTAVFVRKWNAEARAAIVAGKGAVDIAAQARATAELLRLTGLLDKLTGRK